MTRLERFARKAALGTFTLTGSNVLVEEIPEGPVSKEITGPDGRAVSLILSASNSKQLGSYEAGKPLLVRVLHAGAGYYDAKAEKDIPLDTAPGFVLNVEEFAVKWYTSFAGEIATKESRIGIVDERSAIGFWPSEEAYQAYSKEGKDE